MFLDILLERFRQAGAKPAVVWKDNVASYVDLLAEYHHARDFLLKKQIAPGSIVALEAEFSPRSIGFLLALIENSCTLVPLTDSVVSKRDEFLRIAQVEHRIEIDLEGNAFLYSLGSHVSHPLLEKVRRANRPALILFSSGSTGVSKAAIHDFVPLLEKFYPPRNSKRMISFLLFDHIGGINTLLYCLYNAGTLVTLSSRTPRDILEAIEKHRVQILPTSPTFINLLLLSHEWKNYDLSSLELITYGTEPMPQSTLDLISRTLPNVQFQQTYGLSELGILRSKSRSRDSLWMKVGGEGFETRVVDGLLEIKARSAMLGYLNAPSPFTDDGWFKTGDAVEVDGEWIRVLGRKSEMINVGGQKVFPQEVENVIQMIPGVEQVVVTGEPNPITGSIVTAKVKLSSQMSLEEFKQQLRAFCKGRLPNYMIPQRVGLEAEDLFSSRFKKSRQNSR